MIHMSSTRPMIRAVRSCSHPLPRPPARSKQPPPQAIHYPCHHHTTPPPHCISSISSSSHNLRFSRRRAPLLPHPSEAVAAMRGRSTTTTWGKHTTSHPGVVVNLHPCSSWVILGWLAQGMAMDRHKRGTQGGCACMHALLSSRELLI